MRLFAFGWSIIEIDDNFLEALAHLLLDPYHFFVGRIVLYYTSYCALVWIIVQDLACLLEFLPPHHVKMLVNLGRGKGGRWFCSVSFRQLSTDLPLTCAIAWRLTSVSDWSILMLPPRRAVVMRLSQHCRLRISDSDRLMSILPALRAAVWRLSTYCRLLIWDCANAFVQLAQEHLQVIPRWHGFAAHVCVCRIGVGAKLPRAPARIVLGQV